MNALWSPGSDDPRPPEPAPPAGSLAGRQAALVAALVAGDPDPAGIPAHLLTATRTALLRKRADAAAAAWPLLAAGIGAEWPRVFADRFAGVPPYGAEREGWDLAREHDAAGALGPGASRELADRERTFRYDGRTAPSRRWWRGGRSHL